MSEEAMRKHYEKTPKETLIKILVASRKEVEKLQNRNKERKQEIERLKDDNEYLNEVNIELSIEKNRLNDIIIELENERDILKSKLSETKADIHYLLEKGENIYIRRKYKR